MKGPFSTPFAAAVTVADADGCRSARAFLRPVSLTTPETPTETPLGLGDGRRWKIILEPMTLRGVVTISDGAREYLMLRHACIGGDHIEGLLCLKEGTDAS